MAKYLVKRLLFLLPLILGVTFITFSLLQLVPSDPVLVYLRIAEIIPTPEVVAQTKAEMGLDEPFLVQYVEWLQNAAHMDFGVSYISKKPVVEEIAYYFPATVKLTLLSLVFIIILSVPVGVLAALYKDTWLDNICRVLAFIGASAPEYWLAILLVYLFSLKLGLLPTNGDGGIEHLILPALSLSLGYVSMFVRFIRTSMLDNLKAPHVLYAKARGISKVKVIFKHVLRNILLPLVTCLGMNIGHILSGSVIIETLFAWPGIGRYCIESIFNRDYPVIMTYVLFVALMMIVINIIVDVLCYLLDPRLKREVGE